MMSDVGWLFVRGLIRESRHWQEFVDQFREAVPEDRVETLDLPGIGKQEHMGFAADIDKVVDDLRMLSPYPLNEKKISAVAMSLGAMIMLRWAERFPEDFNSLVVINTSSSNLSGVTERFSVRAFRALMGLIYEKDALRREQKIIQLTSAFPERHLEKAEQWALFAPPFKELLSLAFRQLWVASRFKTPHQIEVPLLVLVSMQDRFVDPRASLRISKHLGAENKVHLTAGHDLALDDPEWLKSQLLSWKTSF